MESIMQTSIEIRTEKYWVVFDISKLAFAEVESLSAEQYSLRLVFNYSASDLTTVNIEAKFTIDEVQAIVESIKAIKNPRQELPPRGFFAKLFSFT